MAFADAGRGVIQAGAVGVFGAFWASSFTNFSIWSSWWEGILLSLMALLMAAPARGAKTA